MTQKTGSTNQHHFFLWLCVAFICGFLTGTIFSVFKIDTTDKQTAANMAEHQTQHNQAILSLEAKVTSNPKDGDSWINLGHLYFDANEPAKAIQAYTKGIDLTGGDANIFTDIAIMYRRTGNPKTAIEWFDKAIEIDALHQFSRLNKGIVLYYDLNKPQAAILVWEELLKINPQLQVGDGVLLADNIKQLKAELAKQQ